MNEDRLVAKVRMGILKPASEVFSAIVNPEKMSKYFISGSTGKMEDGKTLIWTWADFDSELEIKVGKIEQGKTISFEWNGSGTKCVVIISLEPKGDNNTSVKITESDWPADFKGANQCMGQVEGWTNFLCCLKAFLEHGIDLRAGAYS